MKRAGFTLLELLVTLAIVAILAGLAWPGYAAIIQRAQRIDARLALLNIQHAEELHYQNANAYTDALTQSAAQGGLGLAARSTAGSYALAISISSDAQHFTATARAMPDGRQAADHACALFTLDETGKSSATDASGAANALCWR